MNSRSDADEERGTRDRLVLRTVLAATLMLAVGLLIWSSRVPSATDLPTDLQGRWTTVTPPLAGRGFVVAPNQIGFDQGEGQLAFYRVRRVRHEQMGALHRYRITYRAEGGDAEIDLEHDPAARTMRITSRPGVIWRR